MRLNKKITTSLPGLTEGQQVGNDSDVMRRSARFTFLHSLDTDAGQGAPRWDLLNQVLGFLKNISKVARPLACCLLLQLTARHEIQSAPRLSAHY